MPVLVLPRRHAPAGRVLLVTAALAIASCGGQTPTIPRAPHPGSSTPDGEENAVLVGAGDIASCRSGGDEATAALLDGIAGTVFTLGDNAYDSGSPAEFDGCYDPSWGRQRSRTRPVPGNHDYKTAGGRAYYDYFGASAGPVGRGYYSYDLAGWHIVALNGEISMRAGSAQEVWLRHDLADHPAECTLAYWHEPRFSSAAVHADDPRSRPIWEALYDAGAEIVLNGHDHDYERFAPQTPDAVADAAGGIREFIVGTGGRSHYGLGKREPNSEVFDGATYGVLKLALHHGDYDWEFIPVEGGTFRDSGHGTCHPGRAL